ncbi:hypothetical protein MH215_09940 [Paenibacillus sp. ACRSA]|uniref:hypothetical protein n=1 Tax=Paenibacillus sp. ACRSA TaxID=2918211 RepID=UPI001EF50974|nr:hypothetical protein [Paenibacillus sp. ACRSA]MCG7377315.1 hypothetical protein [Paenibacillus sp. ACRSA]
MREFEKQAMGVAMVFAGIILYGIVHLSTLMYLPSVMSYSTQWGKYLQAVYESGGLIALIASIVLFLIGVVLLIPKSFFSTKDVMNEIRERDREFNEKYGTRET